MPICSTGSKSRHKQNRCYVARLIVEGNNVTALTYLKITKKNSKSDLNKYGDSYKGLNQHGKQSHQH